MNNYQCYCYGVVALNNIVEAGIPITDDAFYHELNYLWDFYSEEDIERRYSWLSRNGKMVI